MSEELYFKDPNTGELRPDKRRNDLVFTLAKINKQQEDTDRAIANQEKMIEARMGMFEQLLRSKLEGACKDIENVKETNESSNKILIDKFQSYYMSAITQQKRRDLEQDGEIAEIKTRQDKQEARIIKLEQTPVQTKAKNFDKVLWAIIGVGSGFLLTFLKNLLEMLSKVGS